MMMMMMSPTITISRHSNALVPGPCRTLCAYKVSSTKGTDEEARNLVFLRPIYPAVSLQGLWNP